jgi:hypothetical protein
MHALTVPCHVKNHAVYGEDSLLKMASLLNVVVEQAVRRRLALRSFHMDTTLDVQIKEREILNKIRH